MPFRFRVFACSIALLACAAGARAQDYGAVVVFGDSLSDSGNAAHELGLPPGTAYTTNPDPVWAEIVARALGVSGAPSAARGTNYAVGGACVDPDADCKYPSPGIGAQIDAYLAGRSLAADPDALHVVWGGVNDIDTVLDPGDGNPPADPRAAAARAVRAAQATVGHVRRLKEAGARHIAVFNLPDPGATPFAAAASQRDPQLPAALTGLAQLYNRHLDEGLGELGGGIVPINIFALLGEAVENPAAFGFTDILVTACSPVGPDLNALACGPAGSGAPSVYEPGADRTHLFADLSHPGGAAHAMVASAVMATLRAPVQVSVAGEAGVAAVSAHRRAVAGRRAAESGRPVGGWHVYTAARTGRMTADAPPRLGEARTDLRAVTLGAGHRATENLSWGAALSLGRHESAASGVGLDGQTAVGSLHGAWRRGALRLDGALNLGSVRADVARSIRLGEAARRERGSTRAGLFGADVDLGWIFPADGSVSHGPALGLSWLRQEVDGYREAGASSTAMNFSGFDRNSLVLRGGYRVAATAEIGGAAVRPYAAVALEREFEDDAISVTAGSNTVAGRFTAAGFAPPRQWLSAEIGVSASMDGRSALSLGYSGRYGDGGRRDHAVSLALRVGF